MMQFAFVGCLIFCLIIAMIQAIDWQELSASVDGKMLVAISRRDGIYFSFNGGSHWIQSNAPTNLPWSSVSMSGDGRVIAATTSKHGIYLSVDSGKTWNRVKGTDANEDWKNIRVSASGETLIACSNRVLSSEDYGETWKISNLNVAIENLNAVSIDDSGQHRVVVGEAILTSKDYGESWKVAAAPFSAWSDVACSADGIFCFAATLGEGIFSSRDYGVTWIKTSAPELLWTSIASDTSCEEITAVSADGVYLSTNAGATWRTVPAPRGNWISVTMTTEGSSIYALQEKNEMIYESHDRGQTWYGIDGKQLKKLSQVVQNNEQEDMKDLLRGVLSVTEDSKEKSIIAIMAAKVHAENLNDPTGQPSSQPTGQPSTVPSSNPTFGPTSRPTQRPITAPTSHPSRRPTRRPSGQPTVVPSAQPIGHPSQHPTSQPSSQPSHMPSSQPSAQPTSIPTNPTFAPYFPTQIPTASPTIFQSQLVAIQATFLINGVQNETLTNVSLAAIYDAIYATAPKPCTVKIISYTVVGTSSRRMLVRVVRDVIHELATTKYSYSVNSQIIYNTVDYPNENVTYLATSKTNEIVNRVSNGSFTHSLQSYARTNTAVQLLNSSCNSVNTSTTVVSPPTTDHYTANLTDGQIAGIIIGSVIGVFLLIVLMYYLLEYRRTKLVVVREGQYKANDGRGGRDVVVLDDGPSGYFDEAVTIHVDGEENRQPTTDVSDGYMRIHL